jgi:DNA-binding NtrC family response regulator
MLITGKTLFAFVDPKDPFMPTAIAGEEQPGPILSILSARRFDFLLLFYTPHTRKAAGETRREVEKRYPSCMLMSHEIPVSDPKDYSPLMGNLARQVREIVRMSRDAENSVCVSSGTAEMRAAWFLLTAVGVLPATLLQVGSPAQPLFGAANVKEVQTDVSSWRELRDLVMPLAYFEEDRSGSRLSGLHLESIESRISAQESHDGEDNLPTVEDRTSFVPAHSMSRRVPQPVAKRVPFHPQLEPVLQEIGLVVTSAELRMAAERAAMAAPSSFPVLLLGETGTGKELFAKLVHRLSDCSSRPLITVNCAAIPEELAESILFGHTSSAFTGAKTHSKGIFGEADGRTVFLDEIGELPLKVQPKLLRVLQEGTFTRLGQTTETKVDVRVIAATNRNLKQEVAEKRFREDLFFRLNVARIELPPLRSRRGDIRQLATAFLERINQRRPKSVSLSKEALNRLENYSWPGNVRELLLTLESSVLFATASVLGPEDIVIDSSTARPDLFVNLPSPEEGFSMEGFLAQVRKQLILRALDRSKGNQAQAAKLLGISKQAVSSFCKGEQVNTD